MTVSAALTAGIAIGSIVTAVAFTFVVAPARRYVAEDVPNDEKRLTVDLIDAMLAELNAPDILSKNRARARQMFLTDQLVAMTGRTA